MIFTFWYNFQNGEVFYLLKNKFIADILECSKITKGILFFQLSRKDILFQRIPCTIFEILRILQASESFNKLRKNRSFR